MRLMHTSIKTGTAVLLSSIILVGLTACSEAGGPTFAETPVAPPIAQAMDKDPFDNTDIYKGKEGAETPEKVATIVESLYRTSASHETRTAAKNNAELAGLEKAEADKKTFAEAKKLVYQGSMSDEAVYQFLRDLTPPSLPEPEEGEYTYELLIEQSKVVVGDRTADVSLEGSYGVKDGKPAKIAPAEVRTIKLTQINGQWLVDLPGTMNSNEKS